MSLQKKHKMKKWDLSKDDDWIRIHFEELVNKYAGKYIVVAGGEVFSGKEPTILDKEARKKHPGVIPIGMPVPRPQDFICAL